MQWCLPLKSAMKGYDSEKVIFDCSMLLFNRAMWALDNTKAICDSVVMGKSPPARPSQSQWATARLGSSQLLSPSIDRSDKHPM